ncbi:hypothetical protein Tco_1442035 [Tanacetum coccineum]
MYANCNGITFSLNQQPTQNIFQSKKPSYHSRWQGNNAAGQARMVKCYNCQGKGHLARQCTQLKRLRNSTWFKEKMLLTEDLDAYDSGYDDISLAKAILMANLSSYSLDALSEDLHSSKRAGDNLESDKSKKQKVDEHVEDDSTELKRCIEIVLDDEDEVTIDATPLSSKSPIIIDYKIHKENFNREDLEVLWSIVKNRFKKAKPVDDMDNLLYQTLKTMFKHHVEDNIWKYQQGLVKVLHWKLFDSCGVYTVAVQNMIQKMNIKFRGGLLGLKDFKMILRGYAAQKLRLLSVEDKVITTASTRVSTASIEVTTVSVT